MKFTNQNHHEFSPDNLNLPLIQDCINYSHLTVTPEITVGEALILMSEQQTSCAFVVENSQLVGTFTERDVVRITASGANLFQVNIAEVMTKQLITLKQSDTVDLFAVVSLLEQHKIRHLPILDSDNQLLGIITPESIRQALQPANFLKQRYVADLMTTQVIYAPRTATALKIAQLMAEHQVSCVVIVDGLLPVGIITERDIVQFQVLELNLADIPAENVMSTPLFCLKPTDSLWVAHQEMQRRHVRRLVVTDEQEKLLGIITQTSFLQVLESLEMSAVIAALQQQVEQQTNELRKTNEQLQQEVIQRHKVEAELRKTTNELEKRVAEQTIELSQANALLQQKISDVYDELRLRQQAFVELQQAEQTIEKERDFIAAILDTVGCLIVVLDRQGRILRFNQTCEATTNYSFAEVKGKHFWDIFLIPEEKESVTAVFWQIQAGQFPNKYQNYWLTKQGDLRLIAWSNTAICDATGTVQYLIGTGIDLTERYQAEEALRSSELQLRALFEGANDAMVVADDQGHYVDANPAACKLFGLSKTDLLGRSIAEFGEPGFDFIQAWQEFQASGRNTGEFRLLRPDGTIKEVEYGATANFMPHRHLSILRDMSNVYDELRLRKQTELALQQHIEQQRLISAIAQRIRASLNLDAVLNTTVVEVQQFLEADRVFLYYFQPDYSGTVVVEAVSEGWTSALNAKVEDTYFMATGGEEYRQGRIQAVSDIYTAGLTQCHVDLLAQFQIRANLAVPIFQGENLWGLLVVNQCSAPRLWQQWEIDLMNQLSTQVSIAIQQSELYEKLQNQLIEGQQAEEKIRQQAALLDITTDAIVVRNLADKILFWNRGAEQLYGWSAAEAIGKNANELLYKKISPELIEALKTVVEQGEWHGELHQVTKDSVDITVEGRWTLVRDQAGNPKSILVVNTDITDKKQLEAQFLRAQRLESLGTLASGIAHDLNNILTPILTSSQLLVLKLKNLDTKNQQLLKIIENNSKRGADLVKQILTFARGSEGKRLPLQIENLLLEIQHIAQSTFPKSIVINTDLPTTNLWTVLADSTQIHQVLMNLCVNARDAMPNGGTLHLTAENITIDDTYAKMNLDAHVGEYVLITIADSGTGIPQHLIDRIFEPFFTTKEQGKGTGLGLATVIGIVKNHGGFINVSSKIGKGTQFQIYLPAGSQHINQQIETLELHNGKGQTLLIVDDESAILEIIKTSLEEYNYKIFTASNGIEAIALYSQHQDEISIVLLDMMMPSMDGVTTIRVLQQMNPQVKIIVMSGIPSTSQLAEVAGVNIFLHKPYTINELLQAIERTEG